jgi:hypothetical protein
MKTGHALGIALLVLSGCATAPIPAAGQDPAAMPAFAQEVSVDLQGPVTTEDGGMLFQATVTNRGTGQACLGGTPIWLDVLSRDLELEIEDNIPVPDSFPFLSPGKDIETPPSRLVRERLPQGETDFALRSPALVDPYFVTPDDVFVRTYRPHERLMARATLRVFDCRYDTEIDALRAESTVLIYSPPIGPFRLNDDMVLTFEEYEKRLE